MSRILLRVVLAAVAVTVLAVPGAHAAVYEASVEDPRDYRANPARDMKRVASTFDTETGRWTVRVTFFGRVRPKDNARLRLALHERTFGPCHDLEAGESSALAQMFPWTSPNETQHQRYSADGRTLRISVIVKDAIGCRPESMNQVQLSHRRIYDMADGPEFHRRR